jgi:hypothetical protein
VSGPKPTNSVSPLESGAFRFSRPSTALVATALISATIAMLQPFDLIFETVTFDSPLLRGGVIVMLVLMGAACAKRLGLRLEGHGARRPWLVGLLMAVLVAVYVVLLDAFLFRGLLAKDYVEFLGTPLSGRYVYFMTRAFNENVLYRLFAFTVLAALASVAAGRRKLPFAIVFALMIAAQALNIGVNVVLISDQALTPAILTYDALRYIVPGVIWACLFWRYGFFVAEVASVGCHIFLQPALGYLVA